MDPELREVVHSPASRLLIARGGGEIVGMLTLVVCRGPTGARAWTHRSNPPVISRRRSSYPEPQLP